MLRLQVAARIELAIIYATFIRDEDERARVLREVLTVATRFHQRHQNSESARLLRFVNRGTLRGLPSPAKQSSPGARMICARPSRAHGPAPAIRIRYPDARRAVKTLSPEQAEFFAMEGIVAQFFHYRATKRLRRVLIAGEELVRFASGGLFTGICLEVKTNHVVGITENVPGMKEPFGDSYGFINSSLRHYNLSLDFLVRSFPFSRSSGFAAADLASQRVHAALSAIDPAAMAAGSWWSELVSDIQMGDWTADQVLLPRF
jgi:hypothetical protein